MNQFGVNYSYLWRQRKPCHAEVLLFPTASHLCGERYKETIGMQPTGVPPVSFFSESKCWEPSTGSCFLLCLWPGNWDQGSRITKGSQEGQVFLNKRRLIWDDQPSSLWKGRTGVSLDQTAFKLPEWQAEGSAGRLARGLLFLTKSLRSLCTSDHTCLPIYLSIYLSIYIYQPICISIYPSIYLPIHPATHLFFYHLSIIYLSINRHSL